jgi:hypothetical protein
LQVSCQLKENELEVLFTTFLENLSGNVLMLAILMMLVGIAIGFAFGRRRIR